MGRISDFRREWALAEGTRILTSLLELRCTVSDYCSSYMCAGSVSNKLLFTDDGIVSTRA